MGAFTSVGASLRAERTRRGLTLAELAERTKISAKFLTDIESERFDALPGVVFTRNFVRTYASELGMDPDPLLAELPRVDVGSSPMPEPPRRESRTLWDPRLNSALASAVWIILAGGAAVAAYVHFNKPAASPTHTAAPAQQPIAKAQASAAPAAPRKIEPIATVPQHPVEVVLTAHQPAWVQITADGKNDFTGVLQPQDTRKIEANELVKVITGNAGGVAITLNGKQLDQLGPEGQVRTVRLTAEGPQLVLKTPPPQPQQPSSDPL